MFGAIAILTRQRLFFELLRPQHGQLDRPGSEITLDSTLGPTEHPCHDWVSIGSIERLSRARKWHSMGHLDRSQAILVILVRLEYEYHHFVALDELYPNIHSMELGNCWGVIIWSIG